MKRSYVLILICLFLFSSCTSQKVEKVTSSDSLYIRKIENLPEDLVMGMDVSSLLSLEQSGVKYYDFDGTEKDLMEILTENGINTIRVRVWNDPFDEAGHGYGGGNCNIDTAVEIGNRLRRLIADNKRTCNRLSVGNIERSARCLQTQLHQTELILNGRGRLARAARANRITPNFSRKRGPRRFERTVRFRRYGNGTRKQAVNNIDRYVGAADARACIDVIRIPVKRNWG